MSASSHPGVSEIPAGADVVVVGGGSAGAAVAGTIAELSELRVVLLEAGPDYGPKRSGRWPEALMDPSWTMTGGRPPGTPGWTADELAPIFESAWRHMQVAQVTRDELTPFQAHALDVLAADGIPSVADLNDLDDNCGVAPFPTNTDADGVRIDSAFGYVDPMRDRRGLSVIGNAEAERVRLRNGQVEAITVRIGEAEVEIRTPIVVASGGAYGSPALLLRSGVGSDTRLNACGVPTLHDLPGVGQNLHDQPT
jgi:choline dehydrogenase